MDYKKKYEEMVQRAKELHEAGNELTKMQMEIVCPDLKESEDERIINELIESFEAYAIESARFDDCLAWLEKQKESLHISETCKDNPDSFTDEDEIREVLIQIVKDAWDGVQTDRVSDEREYDACLAWLEKQKEQKPDDIKREWWNKGYLEGRKNAHIPARELGLPSSWDFQKEQKPIDIDYISGIREELLGIKNNARGIDGLTESQWVAIRAAHRLLGEYIEKEQKPVFNEDDERLMELAIHSCEMCGNPFTASWLKSLRPQPKQEWSEFDKGVLEDAICATDMLGNDESFNKSNPNLAKAFRVAKDWLKSLRPSWKPSEKKYDGNMDKECIKLCDTLNSIPSINTFESCCGHLKDRYSIWFFCNDIITISRLGRCVERNYSDGKWELLVDSTDTNPIGVFWLRSKVSFQSYDEMEKSVNELCNNIQYWFNTKFDSHFNGNTCK